MKKAKKKTLNYLIVSLVFVSAWTTTVLLPFSIGANVDTRSTINVSFYEGSFEIVFGRFSYDMPIKDNMKPIERSDVKLSKSVLGKFDIGRERVGVGTLYRFQIPIFVLFIAGVLGIAVLQSESSDRS